MYVDIKTYLSKWLPKFEKNNGSYIMVTIGCAGGQHRSVYLCEKLAKYYATKINNVQVKHRELSQ